MPLDKEFDQKLLIEQLRLHKAAAPQSVLVAALAGLSILAVLWNHIVDRSFLAWMGCLPVALIARIGVAWAHGHSINPSWSARRWLWAYRASLAFHGLTWAVMSLQIWPYIDTTLHSVLGLALFAVAIVSLMVISYDAVAAFLFAVPALSPLSVLLVFRGLQYSSELRLTVLGLLAMTLLQVWRANRAFYASTRQTMLDAQNLIALNEKTAEALTAQRALTEKSALLSLLMETSQQGFWFLDTEGITLDINPAMCRKLGHERDSILGKNACDFFAADDLLLMQRELAARRQGTSGRFEIGLTQPAGERAYFLVNATVMYTSEGTVTGSIGVWTDITQRRRDNLALRIYEVTVNSITDMVSVVGEDGIYRLANDAWCQKMDLPLSSVVGHTISEIFPLGSTPRRRNALYTCIETQEVQSVADTVNRPSLIDKVLETTYYPYTDEVDGARCVVLVTREITERIAADEKLRAISEELIQKSEELNVALENIAQGFISYQADGHITVYNQRALDLLELPNSLMTPDVSYQKVQQFQLERGDLVGMRSFVDSAGMQRYYTEGQSNSPQTYVRQTRSGAMVEIRTQTLENGGWVRTFTDVTPYLQALQALRESESEQSAILNSFPGYISTFDHEFKYTYVNNAFASYLNCKPEQIVGRHVADVLGRTTYLATVQEIALAREAGISRREVRIHKTPSGKLLDIEATHVCGPHKADGTQTYYSFAIDITDRKNAEAKITELAFFDQLTGLPNRTLLMDRLKQSMASNTRHPHQGALLLIDLDNFKTLNDTLGHDIGDLLLKQVAARLLDCIREGDTVARLGGDEFVIVLVGLELDMAIAASAIEVVAQKIGHSLAQPYLLNHVTYHCSASIGATLFSVQESSIDELLKQADLAMYTSKDSGRNTFRFFDRSMQSVMAERSALESDLRRALAASEFVLYFQPQVDRNGKVSGCEALVRWQHPDKGLLTPAGFIPMAEESGLILPLGAWVLEQACEQLATWSRQPTYSKLIIAVNVSAKQMRQSQFVADVVATLERTGANPSLLKLELTESVLIANLEDVIGKMSTLKAMGVGLSLDDFGTGFSSLSYLSRLPLDQIKIDRSFVSNIETRDDAVAICAATISLAHALKLQVVAEGVETEPQRYFLSTVHKCDYIQGYLYSPPVSLASFESSY